jgi:hypothetical protein
MEALFETGVTATAATEHRLRRAMRALARWTGWWLASGLVVFGILATSVVIWHRTFSRESVEMCLATAVPGMLLATLLWRRRRESDGPLASMILGAGFWAAFWIAIWKHSQP